LQISHLTTDNEVPVLPGGGKGFIMNIIHLRSGRTLTKPLKKFFQGFFGAFRQNFHIPIGKIADPSAKAQTAAFCHATITKAHSLHPAFKTSLKGGKITR
jgi:hypothetical protein